jgi:peptidyl-prolyl cis-trans isomerase D
MAKTPANPTPPRDELVIKKRRGVSLLGSVLLGLIALSMLGFGVTSFGGGTARVGTVGDQEITATEYANALQGEVNRFSQMVGQPVALRDLLPAGLDRQVMADLIRQKALDGEMALMGLSVGDTALAAEVVKVAAFQGIDGQFDRAAYGDTLRRNNMSEAEFEAGLRADIARGLLQSAISGGAKPAAALTETLLAYAGETRDITFIPVTEADLPQPLAAPTDSDLQAEYDADIASYTRPEAKRIQYVALLPETLAKDMPADAAAVEKLYQDRIDQYVIPEKRLVERLVYPNAADAAAAKAKLDAGTSFEDLVAARNLTLADIDLGDVSKAELGAAGDAVFALTEAGVVGPIDSDLGPALFRMNAILPAQETTLDAVRAALTLEVQTEAARAAIGDRIDSIDDALAGGATLEDLAASENLTLASTDYAKGADDNDPVASYGGFIKAADALAQGDFPEAVILEDGGVVAMALVETLPPAPRPLADVKEKVTAAWRAKALTEALKDLAETKVTALNGGADLASLGTVKTAAKIARDGAVDGAPTALITAAFAAELGAPQVVVDGDFVTLMQLDAITPAIDNPAAADLRATLDVQLSQSLGADVFDLFGGQVESAAGIMIDQNVINSVHTQMGN